VNLAITDFMSVITKIAHVETTTAIWEFDPTLSQNRVLGDSLDIVAAIRTLAIKIQASGQRVAYFERLQKECGIDIPLKIPLHSNVRWGTADGMLARSYNLRQVQLFFIIGNYSNENNRPLICLLALLMSSLVRSHQFDALVIQSNTSHGPLSLLGHLTGSVLTTHTPFYLTQTVSSIFSHMKPNQPFGVPSQHLKNFRLHGRKSVPRRIITCIRMLLTVHFGSWVSIIPSLMRRRSMFLLLVSFIWTFCDIMLTNYLVLHPYYKLAYVEMAWGGAEEEKTEREAGNLDAKDWHDEALQMVQQTMEEYWNQQVEESNNTGRIPTASQVSNRHQLESEYDRHRRQLLRSQAIHVNSGGWKEELRRYLHDMPGDVTKKTDIVAWWAVSTFISIFYCCTDMLIVL
jgi:hypothetical protein